MTENTQALIIFVLFMAALGWAGAGDYEYRKHQEQKELKRILASKP